MRVMAGSQTATGGVAVPAVGGRRRWGQRVTLGHVVPVVLALLAALFVLVGLRDRAATVQVPVALGAISAGSPVNASDTRLVSVHRGDRAVTAGLVSADQLGSGLVAATPIQAGDPITASEVAHGATAGSGLGSMSIPVPVDQADGGDIAAGDRVDVIASGAGTATYVAQGLGVLAVSPRATSGILADPSGDFWVTVAVDRATALRVAAAMGSSTSTGSSGGLQVVRSTGETQAAPQASYPTSSGSGSGRSGG